jgi:hypothetical protein
MDSDKMDFYLKLKDKFDEIREFIRDNDPDSEVFYMLCVGRFVETEEDSVALELSYSTDLDDIEELDEISEHLYTCISKEIKKSKGIDYWLNLMNGDNIN